MSMPPPLARIIILCICMLGSYYVQGQTETYPPRINEVQVGSGIKCSETDFEVRFNVRNGYTRTWVGIWIFGYWEYGNYISFRSSTNYDVLLNIPNAPSRIIKTFVPNKAPGNTSIDAVEISTTISLPADLVGTGYTLQVVSSNPEATSLPSQTFQINKKPSPPSVVSNTSVCLGGTLELSVNDNSGSTYNWTGPGGYTFTGRTLSRPNATTAMAGTYRVTATANGCTSEPATTEVKVDTPVTNNHISLSTATTGSIRRTANENGNLVMDAPAGTIFTSVQFASYGTPTDNNGTFSTSNCHAPNSKAIVESFLLGKSTATIPATNAVFTDPCVGTGKRLYVQATYQATTTTICSGTNPGIIPGSIPQGGASTNQFLWESSNTGATGGFSAAAGTNNTKDYNPGNLEKTTWFRRKVNSGSCSVISNTLRIDVKQAVPVPSASNNGPLCTGATLNLYATEVAGGTYQWTGPNDYISTERNPVIQGAVSNQSGVYSVTATVDGCTSEAGNTTVTINPIIPSTGNENLPGVDSWIGHVYDGTNFETYMGTYTEPETFAQGFGGNEVCFSITSNGDLTSIYTETFSVRYLNNTTKNGLYVADLTSDDGILFKINGNTVHENWVPRSPTTDANVLLNLDQQNNLLTYEYYENGGGNVVQFQNLRKVTDNTLTDGTNQTVCEDKTAQPIVGDAISLVPGVTTVGTGYQWVYSTTENGEKNEISGANQKDYTPDLSAFPFNTPGKYFIYRQVSLQSTNNTVAGNDIYTTTHTSNPAEVVIAEIPQVELSASPTELCEGGIVEFSAIFTGSGSYMVSIEVNGISMGSIPVNDNNFQMPYAVNVTSTFRVTSITDQNTRCTNNSPNASVTIEVDQPISTNDISGDQVLCGSDSIQELTGSTPTGGNGTFTYEWLSSTTGPDEGFNSIGDTNVQNYTPEALLETTWFKRKVTSGACGESISDAVKITVYDEISNNIISYSGETGNACIGSSALEVIGSQPSGGDGEYTYFWESSTSGPDEGFEEAEESNFGINYTPGELSETTWFRRRVTSAACEPALSNVVEVRVNALPTLTATSGDTTICIGDSTSLTGTLSGTGPWTIRGTMNGAEFSILSNSSSLSYTFNPTTDTSIIITEVEDANGCVNKEVQEVSIYVDQPISNNEITGDQVLCGSDSIQELTGSTPTGGNGTFTYEWLSSTTGPDEDFTPVENSNVKNYSPGILSGTTWFKRKVTSGVCAESFSDALKVTIYHEIANNSISYSEETGSVCTGSSALEIIGSQPTGGDGEYNYRWESSTSGPDEGFNAAEEFNTGINYTPGELSETTWFRRTVSSQASCVDNVSEVIKITVNPLPTATLKIPEVVCSGQQVKVEGSFTGTAPWTISVSMGASNPINYTISDRNFSEILPITQTTSFVVNSIKDANCVNLNPQISFTITVNNEWEWTGAEDTNWNNTANWSCNSLPTLQTNVLIPADLPSNNYPIISAGTNAMSKNLTIEAGGSVIVNNNWLQIAGNLNNAGVLNAEAGSISFQGESAQIIPSGAFANDNILNLNVRNTAGVTSQANVRVLNSLKVENGYFNTGNTLLLVSNEAGTAFIDGNGKGQVLGTVKMQRYLSNAFGYKYFSTPFQNSTVNDLAANFDLTNTETGFPHVYKYIEGRKDTNEDDLTGWQKYLNLSNSLEPGHGYAINPKGVADTLTLELSGIVNNGPVEIIIKNNIGYYTNGFNLVGNPYPSPVDWNKMVDSLEGIDNGIYFFTASAENRYTGTYVSYVNNISTDDEVNVIIPSMQGFFVRVSDPKPGDSSATASLQFKNAYRVGNQTEQAYYKTKNKAEIPQIRLKAALKGEKDADATVIYFDQSGTGEFEKELDAQKLLNTALNVPSFYSLTSKNEKLAINAISGRSIETIEIPLGISTERSGEMTIALAATSSLFPSLHVYLKDHKRKVLKDLDKEPLYSFTSQKGQINDRFVLMFSSEKLSPAEIAMAMEDFTVYNENKEVLVKLNLPNNDKGQVILSNMSGQVLQSKQGSGKEEIRFSGILSTGVYLVTLKTEKESQTKKVIFKE